MTISSIKKASEVFNEEFERPWSPMVQKIWGDLAKDSIQTVTDHIKDLTTGGSVMSGHLVRDMNHIEVILGIFIQKVYEQGREDVAQEIANRVEEHIRTYLF